MQLLSDYDRLFIGGRWVAPATSERLEVVSPTTEQVIATVPGAGRADIDRAVAAAREAFDRGPWRRMTLEDRIAVLRRFEGFLQQDLEDTAQLVTAEMGSPITQSRTIQIPAALGILRAYLELSLEYPFQSIRHDVSGHSLVVRDPIGVVAAVIPWNTPLASAMQKLVPALLSGCSFILKPAPQAPVDTFWLADRLAAAGVPDGVFNVLPAEREVSEYLISHPGVDKVAFTGSTAAGRRIAAICGGDLRRVTLELGGKSAAVVLDDADLDVVVDRLRLGSFRNNGQICSLKTRVVVSKARHDELLERLEAMVSSMPVGDPMDPAVEIGPMVTARQRDVVDGYIRSGIEEGARLVTGGPGAPAGLDTGWFVRPTLFGDVRRDARIAQEEIFGPVLSVLPYRDEQEAIDIANDSPYGLNGAVFTTDPVHGLAVARRIDTGTVELNGNPAGYHSPMGGVKGSGMGRESGPEGFDAYVELKAIGVPEAFANSLA